MNFLIVAGFTLMSLAAIIYLFRAFCQWNHDRNIKMQVAWALDTDSLPEAGWAKIQAQAQKEMLPEEYAMFEKAIYALVEKINNINTSGLSEEERLAAFARLDAESPIAQLGVPVDEGLPHS